MSNARPEQNLIDQFIELLDKYEDFEVLNIINSKCRSKNHADVEFTTINNDHWALEAKSHLTSNNHNSAHIVFGELLKETGRSNRDETITKYGVLLSESEFYQEKFRLINREKYIQFGLLIPVSKIFVIENNKILAYTWDEFVGY